MDLLYKRFGLRSLRTLLSCNEADLWDDVEMYSSPDIISQDDHHIATIRKKNRVKYSEPDANLKVGEILCFDVVPNAVGKRSRKPFLYGLASKSTKEVINAINFIPMNSSGY